MDELSVCMIRNAPGAGLASEYNSVTAENSGPENRGRRPHGTLYPVLPNKVVVRNHLLHRDRKRDPLHFIDRPNGSLVGY